MITDSAVFDEDWLPRRLPGREAERDQLLRALGRARTDGQADDVLLSGPSGVGKTTLARHCLDVVREQTGVEIASTRVECLGKTDGTVLRTIGQDIGADVHRGMHNEQLVPALREFVDEPLVVVLDEGDDLPETGVLQALADVPHVSMVAICHAPEDWLSRLDTPLRERFRGEHHIRLPRYSVSELSDILEPRYRQGIRDDVPPYRRLEQIADRAAGVARTGIQTLRSAAELAWDRGHEEIGAEDVDDGLEHARQRIRESNLASLPIHHHVLYEIVRSADGWLSGSEVHDRYEELGEHAYQNQMKRPIGRRARRQKLTKLQDYDLIDSDGEGSSRCYRVIDPHVQSDVACVSPRI